MKKMSCIVVEDDPVANLLISDLLAQFKKLDLLASFQSSVEAFKFLQEAPVDVVFLDVEIPEISGIELARTLHDKTEVVIMTSKKEYALDAFDIKAFDFILKPFQISKIISIIDRLSEKRIEVECSEKPLFIKSNGQFVKIHREHLFLISGEGVYVKYITTTESYLARQSFKEAINSIRSSYFVRVHKSHMVNINKIEKLNSDSIVVNSQTIPIGNSYKEQLYASIEMIS
jgi:DNA-binding LytR/AlgR family response regulator